MYTPETLKKLGQAVRSPVGEAMQAHADAWQARETELIEALKYARGVLNANGGMTAQERISATAKADAAIKRGQ